MMMMTREQMSVLQHTNGTNKHALAFYMMMTMIMRIIMYNILSKLNCSFGLCHRQWLESKKKLFYFHLSFVVNYTLQRSRVDSVVARCYLLTMICLLCTAHLIIKQCLSSDAMRICPQATRKITTTVIIFVTILLLLLCDLEVSRISHSLL